MRVDQHPIGTGVHPLSPGAVATRTRLGTHGAPDQRGSDVKLSCVAFRESQSGTRGVLRLTFVDNRIGPAIPRATRAACRWRAHKCRHAVRRVQLLEPLKVRAKTRSPRALGR